MWLVNRNTKRVEKWKPWTYLLDLLSIYQNYRIIDVAKARQEGVTWLTAGFLEWAANIVSDDTLALVISQVERDAWKFVAKIKFIHNRLPLWMQKAIIHKDSRELVDFVGTNSIIESLPSTEKAGRGTDASIIIQDEAAFHEHARKNAQAIQPAVDSGGQLIRISTIDPWDEENYFTERVNQGFEGATKTVLPSGLEVYTKSRSSRCLVFIPWNLRPVRLEGLTLEQWWDQEILPHTDEIQRHAEYPLTIEEALKPPKTVRRFDEQSIFQLRSLCMPVLREERNGIVRIWKEPQPGLKYIMSIDTSDAAGDYTAGGIIEYKTLQKVADFHAQLPPHEVCVIAKDLSDRYYRPFTIVDRRDPSGAGRKVCDTLVEMGLKMYYHNEKEAGYVITGVNRPVLISDLAEAVLLKQLRDPAEDVWQEFLSFIRTKDKPEGEARRGTHDDWVMMWAMALQARKIMPMGGTVLRTVRPESRW
jgi:hypothetical protein